MFIINSCLLFSVITNLLVFAYKVPQPKIEIFQKGFRVSIPDEEGIELFAFHGNINKEMTGLEAGQFSKDILKKSGNSNEWIFEDQSTTLKPGDKIHFWLFVIKQRLGYRLDDGLYIIRDISATPLQTVGRFYSAWVYDIEPSNARQNFDLRQKESCMCHSSLEMENQILYEMLENAGSKTVKLLGKTLAKKYSTTKDFVENWISHSLLLNDIKVVSAELLANDLVTFNVDKVKDKVRIIMAAKIKLNGANYKLLL